MTSKHPNRTLRDFYNAAETGQEARGKLNVSKSDGENHSNIDNDKGKGNPTEEETKKKQLVISQREEMKKKKKETLPSAYHFPASLAKGAPPTPSSANQASNLLQNSESQSVDLDLSFDYVSKLEQKKRKKDDGNEEKVLSKNNNTSSSNSTKIIQLPSTKTTKMVSVDLPSPNLNLNLQEEGKMSISISPPSPQPPKGMSSASWSARKGPPAPLSLAFKRKSNQQSKIPQQSSVFSPDTVVGENEDSDVDLDLPQDLEDQSLPLTPLSATKRSVDAQSSISMKTKDELPFGTDPKTGMELPLSPSMQKVMVNSTPLPFVELPSSLLELQNANGIRSPPSEPLPPIPLPNLNSESSTSSKASRMMNFRPSFPPEAVYPLSGAANSLGLSFDDPTQSNSKVSLDENVKPLSLSAIEMNSRNRSNSSRSRNQNQNRSQSISSKRSKRPGTGNSNVSGKSFQTANTRPSTDVDGREKRDSFESFETADDEEGEGELEEMNSMIQDDEEEVKEEKKIKNKVDQNFTIRPRFSNQSSRPSLGAMSSNLSENASSNPSIYSLNRHPLSSNGHNSNGAASPSNSHSSPRTPFSPLFSDPGTARSNWTMATSAVPTPGIQIVKLPEVPMVRGGSAPGGRIDRSSIQEPKQVEKIKNEADRSIGLPRSETEEWIKSQTVAQSQDENGNDNNERKREISNETSTSCYSSEQSSHYDADDLEVESQLVGDETKADQQIPKRKRRPTLIVSTEDQGDESEFDVLRKSLDQSKGKNHVQSPLLLSPATSKFNEKDLKTSPRTEPSSSTKLDKRVLVRRALTDASRINPSLQERKSSSPGIGLGLEFGNSSPDSSFDLGLGPRSSLELPTSNSLRRFHSDNSMRRNYQKGDHFKVDMSNSDSNQKKDDDEGALQLSDGFGGFQNALGLSLNGGETVQRKGSFSKNLPDPPMTAPILNGWRKPEDQINPNGNGKKKSVEASPSFSSSLEGFACHVTPPVPAASNLVNSVQIQRASINNNFSSIPLANGSNPNEISLLPIENRPASAWDALANSRWSSKFWSVASSAGLTSVLSSRRNSELNGSSKATTKDGILVSNNKSPVAGQMKTLNLVDRRKNNETMREGTVSAPASSVLSSRSTFESSNFNHQKDSTSNGSPITTNTDSVTSRKQRRNSRIHYISNGNEIRLDMREREKSVDPLLDALKSPRVRDSPTGQTPDIHFGVPISKSRWTMLPGDESKDQVERVLGGDETLEVERNIRRHSSILPMGESSNGLPLWLRGEKFESKSSIWNETGEEIQDDGGLQASRDKLRLLASQTMPGATLPHQYLEIQGARKRVATTRPSHRPTSSTSAIPTATIVPFGWTSVKNKRDSKMHVGTLIKDSNGVPLTTRFAKGTKRSTTELTTLEGECQMNHSESNGELEMPTTSGRPMSIFVPTSSIQAHLLRNSGLNLGSKNQRFSILNQFTPKNVLESSKPSKTLFFAGCLGMPWLWLIGGWWLGEDGLIITTGLDRVEMWKHEASMRDRIEDEDSLQDQDSEESSHGTLVDRKERSSSLPPPIISNESDLKRESFRRESSAPPEISIPGRSLAKVRSHSTIRSFTSSNNTNSIQFNLNVSQSSEKIPKKRTESIASILAFKPEVNFFQSPIRPIPEGFDSNNLALEEHGGKASPRIDNDNPTFEGVETVTGFKNRPNSLTSLHSRRKSKSTINMNVEDQDVQPKSTFEDDEETSFHKESKDRNSIISSNDNQIKNKNKTQSSSSLERFSNYLVYLNRLDRFVLYNRIAALISSLMVFSAFGVALFYVVANF